jgi:hypothetical protein
VSEQKKRIFVSYSSHDREKVSKIVKVLERGLGPDFLIWIDSKELKVGDDLADKLRQALEQADYFLPMISEASNKSPWVQREIAYAVELADTKKLVVIPFLLGVGAEVPFQFKGLLYIDARLALNEGIQRVLEFFGNQLKTIDELDIQVLILPGYRIEDRAKCYSRLGAMRQSDLRFFLSERLSLEEVEVVWFDMFDRRMQDEVQIKSISLSLVELLDRSRRESALPQLVEILCRNFTKRLVRDCV